MTRITVMHQGRELMVRFGRYNDPPNAVIQLYAPDGSPDCTASVNPDTVILPPNYVGIKDWSENEGVLRELIDAGIVSEPEMWWPSGFVEIAFCKILIPEDQRDPIV